MVVTFSQGNNRCPYYISAISGYNYGIYPSVIHTRDTSADS